MCWPNAPIRWSALITQTNALLGQLRPQSAALDQISGNISALSKQLSGFVADNREQFKPSLDKLNGVLTILANRKERLQESIVRLNAYSMSLGESVASGPFFNAYIANLLPGQFLQPFIDAAFSDLGLDPNVMLPSELTDPQTGQAATPALPVPFPRTGQGGEPRLTVPDAITGNPATKRAGSQVCRCPVPAATRIGSRRLPRRRRSAARSAAAGRRASPRPPLPPVYSSDPLPDVSDR